LEEIREGLTGADAGRVMDLDAFKRRFLREQGISD
jgi:hypothetical protein